MQVSVTQDRQKWIGGSDIPIIMGISPFTTRYDLLLFKAGIVKEQEFEGNDYTEYGNVMEDVIRDYVNKTFDLKFVQGKHENEETGIRCHTDGEEETMILEIKTTSQMHECLDDYKIYLVQLLLYMMETNKKKGMLAVYERDEDFKDKTPEQWIKDFDKDRLQIYQFSIDKYEGLCNQIMEAIDQFKLDIAKLKENPLLSEEDLLPTPIQEISKELEIIENQIVAFKDLEKKEKELKAKLFEQMELNGIKSWETTDKKMLITRVDSTPDKTEMVFNEDKFKEEQAVMYESYCEEKIKKGKSGYAKITLRGN